MKVAFQFRQLGTRLTLFFLVVALVPLLGMATITYQQRKADIKQREFAKLEAIRDLKVRDVIEWIEGRIGDMGVIVGDHEIGGLEEVFSKSEHTQEDVHSLEVAEGLLRRYLVEAG